MKNLDTIIKKRVITWLQRFSVMVKKNDYTNAQKMFDKHTFGFGTIAARYSNLKEYQSLQWKECWSGTKNFKFDYPSITGVVDDSNNVIVIGILWTGTGIRPDKKEFPRDGRATIIFRRNKKDNSLISIHNHYSRTPKSFPKDF